MREFRAWKDEETAKNAIGHLRVEFVPITIDAPKSRELDEAGSIALTPAHHKELQGILEFYVIKHQTDEGWRADKTVNQQLKAFSQTLDDLITILGRVNFKDVKPAQEGVGGKVSVKMQTIFRETRTAPVSFIEELIQLRDCTKKWSASRKGGRPPAHPNLTDLLNQIVPIYRAAGGTSVLVSRGAAARRRSKFIDFVWKLMQLLPANMRYESRDALLVWWETNAPAELRPRNRR